LYRPIKTASQSPLRSILRGFERLTRVSKPLNLL
jgi:hypothetical protein